MRLLAITLAVLLALCVAARADTQAPTASTEGSSDWTRVVVESDVSSSSAVNYTAVSDLDVAVDANTNYRFRCHLVVETAANTTGLQLQTQGPASPTEVTMFRHYCSGTVDLRRTNRTSFHASNADDGADAGSGSGTACIDQFDMVLFNGANAGTIQFAIQSEVGASSVTLHNGSWCEYQTF